MTKFITLNSIGKDTSRSKKTTFTLCIENVEDIDQACSTPDNYDNVLFIGHDKAYGDVFKCWNDGSKDFFLYFGTKGDEFPD